MSTWFDENGWLVKTLPDECVAGCSHSGPCDDDVEYWSRKLEFDPPRELAIRWLRETGGWSKDELESSDDETLSRRVLWLACCDIRESGEWLGLVS